MTSRIALLLLAFLVGVSELLLSQEVPESPPETSHPDEIIPIVPPTDRMTSRVAFVLDLSGSMRFSDHAGMAISFAQRILGEAGDELQVAVFAFRESYDRWPGIPHTGNGPLPPAGWTNFPGLPQMESVRDWLNKFGADGGTNPDGAIRAALTEKVETLTVVIITDGIFNGESFKEAITHGQELRNEMGLGRATVIVVGVGFESRKRKHLQEVGGAGGGFYVICKPGESKKEE
jgi:Mg-chelatase subunit ChlD